MKGQGSMLVSEKKRLNSHNENENISLLIYFTILRRLHRLYSALGGGWQN